MAKTAPQRSYSKKTPSFITGSFFLLILCCFILLIGTVHFHKTQSIKPLIYQITGETMGTTFDIQIIPSSPLTDEEKFKLKEGVTAVLDEVNQQINHYDENSQISLYNALKQGATIKIGAYFVSMLEMSQRVRDLTLGGFDVEIGSLVHLWGFGPGSHRRTIPPSAAEIQDFLNRSGQGYRLLPDNSLEKINAQSTLDLSAIAKGCAVDILAEYLRREHIPNFLIEIGGELKTSGVSSDGKAGWNIVILSPNSDREALSHIRLTNKSIATSGTYFNQFTYQDKVYSHLINPVSGDTAQNVKSVSIISESCGFADAVATGLSVLTPDQLNKVIGSNALDFSYLIVLQNGKQLRSKDFPKEI